jgi:hypothetical protein
VFSGAPPARLVLDERALGVSPDGVLRYLVHASFRDAHGTATHLLGGGSVEFRTTSPDARVQWQTRLRFDGPAAIVTFTRPATADIDVRASVGVPVVPAAVRIRAAVPAGEARAVAAALGPHLVQVGWVADARAKPNGSVRIFRDAGRGMRLVGIVAHPATTFRDASVVPATRYRYAVEVEGGTRRMPELITPPEVHGSALASFGGKAMWLSFSPSPFDRDSYVRLDPNALVARAAAHGIRAIELRLAYGPLWEITPAVRPTIDALLDTAAAHGIAVVAWTVPRSTDFDDLVTNTAAAEYRTARGTRFAAVAVDLERGDYFLGDGPAGYAALTDYLPRVRAALGPHYPIVATVEDPFLERLTERDYPYAEIAASADVLQPMAYWRMLGRGTTTAPGVRAALRGSYEATLRAAGRRLPIDIGGQTSGEGPRGTPSGVEVSAAIAEARTLGALGITFFDWTGASDDAWRALRETPWTPRRYPESGAIR